jgi:hypothetical protein
VTRRRLLIGIVFLCAAILFAVRCYPTAVRYYDAPQMNQTGTMMPQYDLFQYYAAGHNWRAGFDPYAVLRDVPEAISIPRDYRSRTISGFIYPPVLLPLLSELSRVGYDDARALWLWISLAALLLPMVLAAALARGRRWETAALGMLLIAASDPLLFHIRQGQVDLIVAAFALTAFLLYGRLRSWPSAALFACAIAIKLSPLVVLLALVVFWRDWRLLVKTFVVGVALVTLSLIVVPWGLYVEYVSRVMPEISHGDWLYHNQSLLRGWGGYLTAWTRYVSLLGFALVVTASALSARVWRRTGSVAGGGSPLAGGSSYVLAFAVLGVLLTSPLSWRMAFVWTIVPMTLVLASVPWHGTRFQYSLVAAGALVMCLPLWELPLLDALETIGALLACAGLLGVLLRPRFQGEDPAGFAVDPPTSGEVLVPRDSAGSTA